MLARAQPAHGLLRLPRIVRGALLVRAVESESEAPPSPMSLGELR